MHHDVEDAMVSQTRGRQIPKIPSETVVDRITSARMLSVRHSRVLAICAASTLETHGVNARLVNAAERCWTGSGMRVGRDEGYTFDAPSGVAVLSSSVEC